MSKTTWAEGRCPKCGSQLLTNGRSVWCSFIGDRRQKVPACDYGVLVREAAPDGGRSKPSVEEQTDG